MVRPEIVEVHDSKVKISIHRSWDFHLWYNGTYGTEPEQCTVCDLLKKNLALWFVRKMVDLI